MLKTHKKKDLEKMWMNKFDGLKKKKKRKCAQEFLTANVEKFFCTKLKRHYVVFLP